MPRRLNVDGGSIAVDEVGDGPPLVLLHASCADRRMWRHQLAGLSDHLRVICYDRRGFGDSEDARDRFAHHADLIGLLDQLGIECASIAGSSDGGRVALDAVLANPERFNSLILVASGVSGHQWPTEMLDSYRQRVHETIGVDRLAKYRSGQVRQIDPVELATYSQAETEFLVAGPGRTRAHLPEDVWSLALEMDTSLNRRWWTQPPVVSESLDPPAIGRLGDVRLPTGVIIGMEDLPAIQALSEHLANSIPRATLTRLPHTGHLPPLERPSEVNDAVRSFVSASL
jgi:pimeloyl-ACP methyl ester carboxylesterase